MPIVEPPIHEVETAAFNCYKQGGGEGQALKDWVQAKRLVFMEKNYDVIAHHSLQNSAKEYLWNQGARGCRYCRTVKPDSIEWKEAYALPEVVGNETLIAMDECPACSETFSSLAGELGKMLRLIQAAGRIEGQTSYSSFVGFSGGAHNYESKYDTDGSSSNSEQEAEAIELGDELAPFIPLAVYKSLTKMALAVMPPAYLPKFAHAVDWIKRKNHAVGAAQVAGSAKCRFIFQPGPMPPDYSHCTLLVRKSPDALIPYMLFSLTMGNQTFQIMVPWTHCDNHLVGHTFVMPEFPAYYGHGYKFGGPVATTLDLASPENIRFDAPRRLTAEVTIAETERQQQYETEGCPAAC